MEIRLITILKVDKGTCLRLLNIVSSASNGGIRISLSLLYCRAHKARYLGRTRPADGEDLEVEIDCEK